MAGAGPTAPRTAPGVDHPPVEGPGTALRCLDGLDQAPGLTTLLITTAAQLHDLSGLTHVPDLVDLWIETCKRVDTIADVAQLTHLRHLTIANCGRIDSLTPIRRLTALETVSAWESTDIADGDLSPLLDVPGLRTIRFASRRHYRPPVQTVKDQLDIRR